MEKSLDMPSERKFRRKASPFLLFLKIADAARLADSFLLGDAHCVRCGSWTCGKQLCRKCRPLIQKWEPLSGRRCAVCGKELVSEDKTCMSCRENQILRHTDLVFPLHSYRLWKKSLLFEWKILGMRGLSPFFADLLYRAKLEVESLAKEENLPLVPVPPRPGKIRSEGWDQIEELCFYLNKLYGVKILRILRRLSKVQQKKLDRIQRLELSSSSYAVERAGILHRRLKKIPEQVILLDDVMTTGATIESCAALLKSLGIKKVHVITLFTVD